MFNSIFGHSEQFKQGEFAVYKSIFRENVANGSVDGYECNINKIPDFIIPQNTWTFDLYISIQIYETQTHIWSRPVQYIKYHIEGVKTNVGWDLFTKINPSNNKFINFYIKKDGSMSYSSEKNCAVKYKILLN
jgi:hypothetical protein